jgi:PAS domain S-box-containing protein/diguanylate cyclase (GGDEF)-like protein
MFTYSADYYAAILDNLPAGVYAVDPAQRIQYWNAGAEGITGYLRQEVIGRRCPDNLLMHIDVRGVSTCGENCPLAATIRDGKPREVWGFLRHKQGHRVPVRIRSLAVRDGAGVIVGAAEIFDEQVQPLHQGGMAHMHAPAGPPTLDELTGLPDHHAMLSEVCARLSDYGDTAIPFGVLGVSIVRLAEFARSHGRQGAQAMLRMVAQTLEKNLQPADRLGRWSEDRFVVVVESCAPASLAGIAQRLASIVSMDELPWWGDRLPVAVTIGGTVVRHGDTVEALLERVEVALAAAG